MTFANSMSSACGALRRDVLSRGFVSHLTRAYSTRVVADSAYCRESVGNGSLGRRPQLYRQQGITSWTTNTSPYSRSLFPSSTATSLFSTKIGGNDSDEAFAPIERTPVPEEADEVCSSSCCQ